MPNIEWFATFGAEFFSLVLHINGTAKPSSPRILFLKNAAVDLNVKKKIIYKRKRIEAIKNY